MCFSSVIYMTSSRSASSEHDPLFHRAACADPISATRLVPVASSHHPAANRAGFPRTLCLSSRFRFQGLLEGLRAPHVGPFPKGRSEGAVAAPCPVNNGRRIRGLTSTPLRARQDTYASPPRRADARGGQSTLPSAAGRSGRHGLARCRRHSPLIDELPSKAPRYVRGGSKTRGARARACPPLFIRPTAATFPEGLRAN